MMIAAERSGVTFALHVLEAESVPASGYRQLIGQLGGAPSATAARLDT